MTHLAATLALLTPAVTHGAVPPESRIESRGASAAVIADRDRITTADRLRVTLTLETPPGLEGALPAIGSQLGEWRVLVAVPLETRRADGGGLIRSEALTLEPFLPGEYEIPALEFRVRETTDNGTTPGQHTLRTSPLSINVESVLDDSDASKTIAPQRGMIDSAPSPARRWWAVGLAAGVLTLGAGGAIVVRRRMNRGAEPLPPEWRIARLELERTLARMDWSNTEAARALDLSAKVLAGCHQSGGTHDVRFRAGAAPVIELEIEERRFSGERTDIHAARRLGEGVMRMTSPASLEEGGGA